MRTASGLGWIATLAAPTLAAAQFLWVRRLCDSWGGLETIQYMNDGSTWGILILLHVAAVIAFVLGALPIVRRGTGGAPSLRFSSGTRAFVMTLASLALSALGFAVSLWVRSDLSTYS